MLDSASFCGQDREDCTWFTGMNGVSRNINRPRRPERMANLFNHPGATLTGPAAGLLPAEPCSFLDSTTSDTGKESTVSDR